MLRTDEQRKQQQRPLQEEDLVLYRSHEPDPPLSDFDEATRAIYYAFRTFHELLYHLSCEMNFPPLEFGPARLHFEQAQLIFPHLDGLAVPGAGSLVFRCPGDDGHEYCVKVLHRMKGNNTGPEQVNEASFLRKLAADEYAYAADVEGSGGVTVVIRQALANMRLSPTERLLPAQLLDLRYMVTPFYNEILGSRQVLMNIASEHEELSDKVSQLVCLVLDAHRRHRRLMDLKPDNIAVDDLGILRFLDADAALDFSNDVYAAGRRVSGCGSKATMAEDNSIQSDINSLIAERDRVSSLNGTESYIPADTLRAMSEPEFSYSARALDLYGMGVIIHEMATARLPREDENNRYEEDRSLWHRQPLAVEQGLYALAWQLMRIDPRTASDATLPKAQDILSVDFVSSGIANLRAQRPTSVPTWIHGWLSNYRNSGGKKSSVRSISASSLSHPGSVASAAASLASSLLTAASASSTPRTRRRKDISKKNGGTRWIRANCNPRQHHAQPHHQHQKSIKQPELPVSTPNSVAPSPNPGKSGRFSFDRSKARSKYGHVKAKVNTSLSNLCGGMIGTGNNNQADTDNPPITEKKRLSLQQRAQRGIEQAREKQVRRTRTSAAAAAAKCAEILPM